MEFIKNFISEYGTTILYAILTAIGGYLGIWAKKLYTKYVNDKTKQAVAKTVVQAVEQLYKDLRGEEKLEKALEAAADMLAERGITVTDLELRILIEAAVGEFNKAFEKDFEKDPAADITSTEDVIGTEDATKEVCDACTIDCSSISGNVGEQ